MIEIILAALLALGGGASAFDRTQFVFQVPALEATAQYVRFTEHVRVGDDGARSTPKLSFIKGVVNIFRYTEAESEIKIVGGRNGANHIAIFPEHVGQRSGAVDANFLLNDRLHVFGRSSPVVGNFYSQSHPNLIDTYAVKIGPFFKMDTVEIKVCAEFLFGVGFRNFSQFHGSTGVFFSREQRAVCVDFAFTGLFPRGVVERQSHKQAYQAGAGQPESEISPISRVASRIGGSPLRAQIGISIALLPIAWLFIIGGSVLRGSRWIKWGVFSCGIGLLALSGWLWWIARP
ncbi:hypothetical protein [Sphingopyxis sp.]|uniref:hypothetical protein n=1 Tax=Sphingopyxis sp. TaxID=1908224 RepID=UPI002B48796A|nr:hypothetical protein [Sphingopyxis sp.]HJS13108.1 hypothetical protein [Sphingopyxis sp.]